MMIKYKNIKYDGQHDVINTQAGRQAGGCAVETAEHVVYDACKSASSETERSKRTGQRGGDPYNISTSSQTLGYLVGGSSDYCTSYQQAINNQVSTRYRPAIDPLSTSYRPAIDNSSVRSVRILIQANTTSLPQYPATRVYP